MLVRIDFAHLAFGVCGLERLGAYSNPANERSSRALERVGFRPEGTLRAWHRHSDVQLDVQVFGMLRAEWSDSPLAALPVTARARTVAASPSRSTPT